MQKDLRFSKRIDETKGQSEIRQKVELTPDGDSGHLSESHIEDIINTEVTLIDDMQKVNEVLIGVSRVRYPY